MADITQESLQENRSHQLRWGNLLIKAQRAGSYVCVTGAMVGWPHASQGGRGTWPGGSGGGSATTVQNPLRWENNEQGHTLLNTGVKWAEGRRLEECRARPTCLDSTEDSRVPVAFRKSVYLVPLPAKKFCYFDKLLPALKANEFIVTLSGGHLSTRYTDLDGALVRKARSNNNARLISPSHTGETAGREMDIWSLEGNMLLKKGVAREVFIGTRRAAAGAWCMAHGGSDDDGVVRVALEEGAAPGRRRGMVTDAARSKDDSE
ncbi:hypothetical protein JB92DRAFT_2833411 [Gautieria morchelliformis]|nr:hypothetical protein JB92DRAFT_2833411 [Gautieria morchelliformis]